VARLLDGRLQVCGSLTDVTARRRMEEELLRGNGFAQQLLDRPSEPPAARRSRHLHIVRDGDAPADAGEPDRDDDG
jgi:hypothetical protein